MPSPEVNEKAKLAADLAGPPITHFQALKARGWLQTYDYVVSAILIVSFVTLFFWKIFASPTALNLISVLLVDIFVTLLWLVSLVFRCSCFVLEVQADINLMPESAARIVAGFYSGNAATTPNRTRR